MQLKPAAARLMPCSRYDNYRSNCRSTEHECSHRNAAPLVFTDNAAAKVKQLIDEEGNPDLKLRVFVTGGGCSGFQYGFTFDEAVSEDDTAMEKNGVTLLIDPDEPAIPRRRGNRLPGRRRRRAVRDQESERDLHLRLRVVVLGLSDGSRRLKRRRGRLFCCAAFLLSLHARINCAEDARAARAGDRRQIAGLRIQRLRRASHANASASTCSASTPSASVVANAAGAELRRSSATSARLRAPPPQTIDLLARRAEIRRSRRRCARGQREQRRLHVRRPLVRAVNCALEPGGIERLAPGAFGRRRRK